MNISTYIKSSVIIAFLTFSHSAAAVPGLGGLYDWWSGTAHFGNHDRMAQGRSYTSCTQDLYTQRNIGVNMQNLTFTGFTPCKKSPYPKNYLLPMAIHAPDKTALQILDLEDEFKINDYRKEVKAAVSVYEDKKRASNKDEFKTSDSELEYIDLMLFLPLEAQVMQLNKAYNIDIFKQKVKSILDAESIEVIPALQR